MTRGDLVVVVSFGVDDGVADAMDEVTSFSGNLIAVLGGSGFRVE